MKVRTTRQSICVHTATFSAALVTGLIMAILVGLFRAHDFDVGIAGGLLGGMSIAFYYTAMDYLQTRRKFGDIGARYDTRVDYGFCAWKLIAAVALAAGCAPMIGRIMLNALTAGHSYIWNLYYDAGPQHVVFLQKWYDMMYGEKSYLMEVRSELRWKIGMSAGTISGYAWMAAFGVRRHRRFLEEMDDLGVVPRDPDDYPTAG